MTTIDVVSGGAPSVVSRGVVEPGGSLFDAGIEPPVLWEQLVVSSPGRSPRSAVVADADDRFVVAGTGEGAVVALAAETGEVVWTRDLTHGSSLEEYNSYAMYPTIADDTVFVASSTGVLYALELATGEERWASSVGGLFGGFPAVVDDTVVVARSIADIYDDVVDYAGTDGREQGGVVAVSASTGEVRWEHPTSLWSTVVVGPDAAVVVTSYDAQFLGAGTVEMVTAATGDVVWTVGDVDVVTPAAVGDDVVVVAAAGLIALTGSGVELWRTSSDWCSCTFQFPVVADGTVVVVTNEAAVYGLDLGSGETCWGINIGDNYGIAYSGDAGVAAIASGGVAGWMDAAGGDVVSGLPIDGQALSIVATAQGSIVAGSDGLVRLVGGPQMSTSGEMLSEGCAS